MSRTHDHPVLDLTTEPMRRRHLRRVLDIEEKVHPRPWTHRTFTDEIVGMRGGTRWYIVAYVGDVLAGYGGLMFVDDDAHVTNIAVDPAWQGRGVATEILLDLALLCHDRGCRAMTLEVRASNEVAQTLYRRFGFVPVGVRARYYENTEDAIIMWAHGVGTDEYAQRLDLIASRRP